MQGMWRHTTNPLRATALISCSSDCCTSLNVLRKTPTCGITPGWRESTSRNQGGKEGNLMSCRNRWMGLGGEITQTLEKKISFFPPQSHHKVAQKTTNTNRGMKGTDGVGFFRHQSPSPNAANVCVLTEASQDLFCPLQDPFGPPQDPFCPLQDPFSPLHGRVLYSPAG